MGLDLIELGQSLGIAMRKEKCPTVDAFQAGVRTGPDSARQSIEQPRQEEHSSLPEQRLRVVTEQFDRRGLVTGTDHVLERTDRLVTLEIPIGRRAGEPRHAIRIRSGEFVNEKVAKQRVKPVGAAFRALGYHKKARLLERRQADETVTMACDRVAK